MKKKKLNNALKMLNNDLKNLEKSNFFFTSKKSENVSGRGPYPIGKFLWSALNFTQKSDYFGQKSEFFFEQFRVKSEKIIFACFYQVFLIIQIVDSSLV